METFTKKHGTSAYSHKTNGVENSNTTHWSKRRIISDDDLNRLQGLIVSDNIDTNAMTKFEISNCACQGACQNNCLNSCEGNCVGDCESGCKAACMQNCVNNLS